MSDQHRPNRRSAEPQAALATYSELEPDPDVAAYVACCWSWSVEPGVESFLHTIPPDGCVSLWYSPYIGFGLTGPQVEPLRVPARGGDRFWGVRFWPGMASALVGFDAGELRERGRVSLDPNKHDWLRPARAVLDSDPSEAEAAEALQSVLRPLAASASPPDVKVLAAVAEIFRTTGASPVSAVAAESGLSPRQLRRRMRAATGLTPKELCRITRVRASLQRAFSADAEQWADVAAEFGFADQPHLVHEYRELTGDTPNGLVTYLRTIRHGGTESWRDRFLQDGRRPRPLR